MRISMKAAGKAAGTFTGIAQYFHSKLLLVNLWLPARPVLQPGGQYCCYCV